VFLKISLKFNLKFQTMASLEIWNLVSVFFRYLSPFKYIILYDPKNRKIRRNTQQQFWFYFQASVSIMTALIIIYLIINPSATFPSKTIRTVAYMFAILYAGITGLCIVFTISVGFRGDTFYNCFNNVIGAQRQQEGKLVG